MIPGISLFLVSGPLCVGFRTLLTFDSPLPGIKYSWALYTALLRGTLHPRNPQEISKVLLPWPSLRNTFERYASNRNPETNATESLLNFAVFLKKPKLLAFYYVFGGTSVSAQLSRNCRKSKLLHRFRSLVNFIRSNLVVSHRWKFMWKLILCTRKGKWCNQHSNDTTRKLLA